jgi:hypothetical protein
MTNLPPFAASNSFVETPLLRTALQTGLFGKTLVFLIDEDIIEFISEKIRRKARGLLGLLLRAEFL